MYVVCTQRTTHKHFQLKTHQPNPFTNFKLYVDFNSQKLKTHLHQVNLIMPYSTSTLISQVTVTEQ